MFFSAARGTRDDVLARIHMTMDCNQAECLVNLNNRFMTEANEIHDIPDGSVLRIWYSVFQTTR